MIEQKKYESIWQHDLYREFAPGESYLPQFMRIAKPRSVHSVVDIGCGTGRGALQIYLQTGASVTMLDFAANCLDEDVRGSLGERFRFRQHDITRPIGEVYDIGYCTDVLEHLPTEDVPAALKNIVCAARRVYFVIATKEDKLGDLVGEPLHLTVQPMSWWLEQLEELGFRVDYSKEYDAGCEIYGSAFADGHDFAKIGSLNTSEQQVRHNIWRNLSLGLQEIVPHKAQPDQRVILLAGGPSLADFEDQIIAEGREGVPIVTTNGAYNWLLARGIKPAAQVMLDARAFNKRFIEPIVDTCKYLICSQSDHDTVASLPKDRTWLWHSGGSDLVQEELDAWAKEYATGREWWPVYGGTTVTSRAITLLAMLGFRQLEIYGWDSCLRGDVHHAYAQPENDSKTIFTIHLGGREFRCHPWQIVQANELGRLVRYVWGKIDDLKLCVHGDGLIAHMLSTSADLAVLNADEAKGV